MFLSSIEWDELWQGHHELASRLAADGNRVLFVENIGVRAPGWQDRGRVVTRVRRWARGLAGAGAREVGDGLWVSSPLLMPPFAGKRLRALNRRVLIPAVARAARGLGMRDPVVWTYLPTDTGRDLIAALRSPSSSIVYSCLADFAELATDAAALTRSEVALLSQCDLVFALPGLVQHCRRHSDHVVAYVPAVNLELFSPRPSHPAQRVGRDAVVGYVGALQRHVDIGLLVRLARERPSWTWVFAGPVHVPVDALAALPNVRLLGPLAHDDLPVLMETFDVGIVPYVISAYTTTVVPTKIGEYLAMGKPVVSTPIPHVVGLARGGGGVVITADPSPEEFLAAIEQALELAGDERTIERCRALAATHGWSERMDEMSAALVASAGWADGAAQEGDQPAHVIRSR